MPDKLVANFPQLINFLNNLFDTNEEFAKNHGSDFFDQFQDAQNPYMTILKCSDSRVQMESFDKTPQNGVFAVRNIGNQIATAAGSIDFGVRILKTPILLIIGHCACGAIEAVLAGGCSLPDINKELSTIKLTEKELTFAIIENVNRQVHEACDRYSDLIKNKKLTIVGAVYDFKNDLGFGKGRIVFTNINDFKNLAAIKESFGKKVRNFHLYMPHRDQK